MNKAEIALRGRIGFCRSQSGALVDLTLDAGMLIIDFVGRFHHVASLTSVKSLLRWIVFSLLTAVQ